MGQNISRNVRHFINQDDFHSIKASHISRKFSLSRSLTFPLITDKSFNMLMSVTEEGNQ